MNKQKGSANVILIILVVILAAAVSYFAFVKKPAPAVQSETNIQSTQPLVSQNNTSPTSAASTSSAPKAVQQVSNIGLKTYTSSKLGFQFQYSSDISTPQDMDAPAGIPGRLFLTMTNNKSPYDNLEINVTTPAYDATAGREACDKGYDNNDSYTHVTINGLDFTKGDVSSNYASMGHSTVGGYTGYCLIASNGNRYFFITNVATPSPSISAIINSFSLIK